MEEKINKKQEMEEKPAVKPMQSKGELTAVIRISGMVKVKPDIKNTLERLRLLRKYVCVLVDTSKKEVKGMLKKVKYSVAYGIIDKDVLVKLIKDRGQGIAGSESKDPEASKFDAEKVASGLLDGKKLSDLGLKPFFRLHPPRKGIKSKLQYPKGVLGNNKKDINKLIERMLWNGNKK